MGSTLLSSENRAFMPGAVGAAACFGTSLIRLPRPPAGMGGGGPGAPRFAGAAAGAAVGAAAAEKPAGATGSLRLTSVHGAARRQEADALRHSW